MEINGAVQAFWRAYCATRADGTACLQEPHEVYPFGDDEQGADERCAMALAGTKRATAGLVWEYEFEGWKTTEAGDKAIILNWAKEPVCIIEMTDVVERPFDTVDAEFTQLEGEGDGGVADWRDGHWRYFSRRCAQIGKAPSEQMLVLCQRFRVVYPR